jgi:TPR repeat protein
MVALMYEDGDGVSEDAIQAVTWYRKAADQGHAEGRMIDASEAR